MKLLTVLALVFIGLQAQDIPPIPEVGGYIRAETCSALDDIGGVAKPFVLELNFLNNFWKNAANKAQLVYLSSQLVAGINYFAIYKLTQGSEVYWAGFIIYQNLQQELSVTKYIQTNNLADVFRGFDFTPLEETDFQILNCGDILTNFLKLTYVAPTTNNNTKNTTSSNANAGNKSKKNDQYSSKNYSSKNYNRDYDYDYYNTKNYNKKNNSAKNNATQETAANNNQNGQTMNDTQTTGNANNANRNNQATNNGANNQKANSNSNAGNANTEYKSRKNISIYRDNAYQAQEGRSRRQYYNDNADATSYTAGRKNVISWGLQWNTATNSNAGNNNNNSNNNNADQAANQSNDAYRRARDISAKNKVKATQQENASTNVSTGNGRQQNDDDKWAPVTTRFASPASWNTDSDGDSQGYKWQTLNVRQGFVGNAQSADQ